MKKVLKFLLPILVLLILIPLFAVFIFYWSLDPYNTEKPISITGQERMGRLESFTPTWHISYPKISDKNRLSLRYTAGPAGIKTGGGIKINLGHYLFTDRPRIYTPFSITSISATFFGIELLKDVRVNSARTDLEFEIQEPSSLDSLRKLFAYIKYKRSPEGTARKDNLLRQIDNDYVVLIKLTHGELKPGDSLDITIGEKNIIAPKRETSYRILARVDSQGTGDFILLKDAPELRVFTPRVSQVKLLLPSILYPGESGRAVLRFEDDYFLPNLSHFKSARIKLDPLPGLDFPRELSVQGENGGLAELSVKAGKTGIYRITGEATVGGQKFSFRSNPLKVVKSGAPKIFWGDLHLHSMISYDADRPPEYVYWRMRHQERFDFACLSDHDMIGAVPFVSRDAVQGPHPRRMAIHKKPEQTP